MTTIKTPLTGTYALTYSNGVNNGTTVQFTYTPLDSNGNDEHYTNIRTIYVPPSFDLDSEIGAAEEAALLNIVQPGLAEQYLLDNFIWGGKGDLQRPYYAIGDTYSYYTDAAAYLYGVEAAAAGISGTEAIRAASFVNLFTTATTPQDANGLDPARTAAIEQGWNDFTDGKFSTVSASPSAYAANQAYDIVNMPTVAVAGAMGAANYVSNKIVSFAGTFIHSLLKWASLEYEPLVLDLTGGGIQTTTLAEGTVFDNQNNGFAEQTAWVGSGSGILVNDPTGGAITNGSQMFGTSTSLSGGGYAVDGFAALAALDSNSDGIINSSDSAWSSLRVWVDSNGNGVTDSGELETMSAAGIASISLTTTNTDVTDANGNYIGKTANYSLTGGGTREVADVSFRTDPALSIPDTTVTVNSTISLLPDVSGYGTVTSLQQAMQIQVNASSTTLETYVQDFVAATDDATRNTLVDEIIYQ